MDHEHSLRRRPTRDVERTVAAAFVTAAISNILPGSFFFDERGGSMSAFCTSNYTRGSMGRSFVRVRKVFVNCGTKNKTKIILFASLERNIMHIERLHERQARIRKTVTF